MADFGERQQFDPPKSLCEGMRRMFAEYGDELEQALGLLTAVQFERFMSSATKDAEAREVVYFSTLGAREFHAFMASLATKASDKADFDPDFDADQQDYS